MKTLIISMLLFISMIGSTYAMRCGNSLVNEGDTEAQMLALCGAPTSDNGVNIVYLNKDHDGMNYFIHVDSNGIIDNVQFSRGGLL